MIWMRTMTPISVSSLSLRTPRMVINYSPSCSPSAPYVTEKDGIAIDLGKGGACSPNVSYPTSLARPRRLVHPLILSPRVSLGFRYAIGEVVAKVEGGACERSITTFSKDVQVQYMGLGVELVLYRTVFKSPSAATPHYRSLQERSGHKDPSRILEASVPTYDDLDVSILCAYPLTRAFYFIFDLLESLLLVAHVCHIPHHCT
jgi:hypothetical protein